MFANYLRRAWIPLLSCLSFLLTFPAWGQLKINFPVARIVLQRTNANQAAVPFHAVVTIDVTEVKVRMVVRQGGTTTGWTSFIVTNGQVSGRVPSVQGGWYDLEAESFNGNVSLGIQRVQRVGVGEVLLISGQSNAQGWPYTTGAADDRVSCVNYYDGLIPEYKFPLAFSHLSASASVGPTNPLYIYGMLGDKLVQRLGVPVLFYGSALAGTSSMQWRQSAEGNLTVPDADQWEGADLLRPYRAIKAALIHYVQRTGLRAIIWHQGESDKGKSPTDYFDNLKKLIEVSRQDVGASSLPWVIARASWIDGSGDNNIIQAQNQVIAQVHDCYAGPNTDDYGNPYRQDGTHFLQTFYPQFAELWNQSLSDTFFGQSTPYSLADEPPRITVGLPQPPYQYRGGHLIIPFLDEADDPATPTVYTAQLLSTTGQFITNLGVGTKRPLQVTLPDNVSGNYQVRVTSSATGATSTLSPPITVFTPSYPKGTGMGLTGRYISGTDPSGPVLHTQLGGPLDLTLFNEPPVPFMPIRDYIISWVGQVEAPVTGTYTIKAYYDDAVRVWINGQLVINEWDPHPWPFMQRGQITLQANQKYDIRVDLLQNWYNVQVRLLWVVPGTTQAVYIPKDRLYSAATTPVPVGAPVQVVFPVSRMVLQRDNTNSAPINIRGICPAQTERVEIRISPTSPEYGQNSDSFVTLDSNPTNGFFSGAITTTAGWYNLDIQAIVQNKVIGHTRVTPVGVGEVFVIAGEGNAQGVNSVRSVVDATDDRVSCVPHRNNSDTIRLPRPPQFSQLSADKAIGPHGNNAWAWSELGDLLTKRLNVPVLFYNVAWAGTTVRNWRESMELGNTNALDGTPLPGGMPYSNLKRVLRDYVSLTGLRAILWQQGESEYYSTNPTATNYTTDLKAIIERSRSDASFSQLPWVIARSSADNTTRQLYASGSYEPVTNRQNEVLQTTTQTLPGPLTDTIQMPRPGGVYFQGNGLTRLANAWNAALTTALWSTSALLAQPPSVSDLHVSIQAASRVKAVGQDVPFTLTVLNEGQLTASNVLARCLLPSQLQFTGSASMSLVQGGLLASLPSLNIGQKATFTFTARPQQPGSYRVASELIRADQLDPDSRPNTSVGNGEDDLAWIDFRTPDATSALFTVSPSSDAPPLPAVLNAQPLPDPNQADLSLALVTSNLKPALNTPISFSLIVRNSGGQPAQNVQVGCQLPTGLTFGTSPTLILVGSTVRGTANTIPAGGQSVFVFTATVTIAGPRTLQAQVEAATPSDPDSTPNNGFTNGEDDVARLTISH